MRHAPSLLRTRIAALKQLDLPHTTATATAVTEIRSRLRLRQEHGHPVQEHRKMCGPRASRGSLTRIAALKRLDLPHATATVNERRCRLRLRGVA